MPWPLSQDYNEAIQGPSLCFQDPELRQTQARCNAIGIPMPSSGNFADVYQLMDAAGRKWAVKCFTRQVAGLRERYAAISSKLKRVDLSFIVDFVYLEPGIQVRGVWYPVLKMDWVEGLSLNDFVRQHADNPPVLEELCQVWVRLARRLRDANIAHGDLQHGNVLLVPGKSANSLSIRLIDYDGMWVPALAERPSGEVGHPAYQHPQRLRDGTYHAEVDRFSHLVIVTALRSLIRGGRYLWNKYDNGDNLLFRQSDLAAPQRSPLFAELLKLGDEPLRRLLQNLSQAVHKPLDQAPALDELAAPNQVAGQSAERRSASRTESLRLDEYEVIERIGQGRMAGVYRARHSLGLVVALKVLPPSRARDPRVLARFQREAGLALRLNHPNVVRTFHTGESSGRYYLVMEYLEGETLRDVLERRGRLPTAEAVELLNQALLGLQYIHEAGLCHRDLGPANLMLVPAPPTPQGSPLTSLQVKILDIGLGRDLFAEEAPGAGLTTEESILGTPEYMAPEQARDAHAADIRSDIYSLGCTLYHALAGRPPFQDKSPVRLLVRHSTEQPVPLRQLNPAVAEGLAQVVERMLAKDPVQRYQTPERAARALQEFLANPSTSFATEAPDVGMHAYLQWVASTERAVDAASRPAPVLAALPVAIPVPPPFAKPVPAGPRPAPAPAAPSAVPSVQRVCNQLSRHRLLAPEQVRAVYQRWLREGGPAVSDAGRFGDWLVAQKVLTDYQAALVLGRRGDRLWVGPYRILSRIVQGPLAGIYQAVHPQGQRVAIKVLPPVKAADPGMLARFQREARLALRLQHPNVVRTFEAGEDNGLHYLVMEHLEGETLKDVLQRRGRLPAREGLRLLYQALQGLQHVHEAGIIHRDLEPGNLLLTTDGSQGPEDSTLRRTVKILDVGLGRALFDEGTPGQANALTVAGELLGTVEYLAPEQARDAHHADIRADIYSLGCVLYHVLVGAPPFVASNPVQVLRCHALESPAPLQSFGLSVPAGLQDALNTMLAKDPVLRYSTPAEAARALRPLLT